MTAIARRTATQSNQQNTPHARKLGWSAVVAASGLVRAKLVAMAAAGQLGPDRETEISRWTGGRV